MKQDVCVLILAAGYSSRLTGFKPLLPLPLYGKERSALEGLSLLYRKAGISQIFVVTGHRASDVEEEALRLGMVPIRNPQPEQGMFSSVQVGMSALLRGQGKQCFLHPVDVPLVRLLTLYTLLEQAELTPEHVIIPVFDGQEGHPPLIPASMWPSLLQWNGEQGLRGALETLPRFSVPVADRFTLLDMDTDDEYRTLRDLARRRHLLEPDEAETLLRQRVHGEACGGRSPMYGPVRGPVQGVDKRSRRSPDQAVAHGRAVGRVAAGFASALRRRYSLDPLLAQSGGLLHDMCKGEPQHEKNSGRLLRKLGLPILARLTEAHRDVLLQENEPITERELVYLADKYVLHHGAVPLEKRFGRQLERFAQDAELCALIQERFAHARALEQRLRQETCIEPYHIVQACLGDVSVS